MEQFRLTPLERAFQLAQTGECRTTTEILLKLKTEGFSTEVVTGRTLLMQLRGIMERASGPSAH